MISFEMRLIHAERRKREAEGLRIRALSASAGVSSHGGRESNARWVSRQSKVTPPKWLAPEAEETGLTSKKRRG
ncbi:hypothetical protein [Bradyrhizobium sp. CCBAU 11361]|uniref:hypothetical protein n=1 Tax=Bradyrhizobium sp. CCBAU 11361 TaxID=1630812 RepID=UPI002303085F|nr:hypothetical protein [Bradyrhizobium sp. CCBAU 11361]